MRTLSVRIVEFYDHGRLTRRAITVPFCSMLLRIEIVLCGRLDVVRGSLVDLLL